MKFWLGKAYLGGEQVSVDPALGRDWLELAADGGITKAWFDLTELQQEQGALEQTRASYAKAAQQGHIVGQYAYGEILRLGQGGKEAKRQRGLLTGPKAVSPGGPAR